MSDLVETILAAAVEAIRNQTPAITSDAGRLKSIRLELELSNQGAVIDSTCSWLSPPSIWPSEMPSGWFPSWQRGLSASNGSWA